ncbi:hypothetical protein CIB95_00570 [Lottiidibacillus patelloidae]|uniref:DUF1269 domain-containing protein n=1 Tax=Lottiidibacillus patelloidae TaxID=2670334 RepID=A0A263BY70_9BACI|nr:hypothetical protein [Lottiidibacillus patelloidae]OZM58106.1 hypothetical protein CIB95_00570 [Lottiidibacillus patelloidae]
MLVVTSLAHSVNVELLISDIQKYGISKKQIFVTSLDKISPTESIHSERLIEDGIKLSFIDLAFAFGTAFSVIGAIYGYTLKWGPINWGLIGFFTGCLSAYVISFVMRKNKKRIKDEDYSEVLIFIQCDEQYHRKLKQLFLEYKTNGTAVLLRD